MTDPQAFSQSGVMTEAPTLTQTGISATLEQALSVQTINSALDGGPDSPYDQLGFALANFQNTAQIVGVGLVDQNGNLISPSDYTLTSASGHLYPLLTSLVPEPSSWIMGAIAIGAVGFVAKRRGTGLAA